MNLNLIYNLAHIPLGIFINLKFLHIHQLKGYNSKRYLRFFKTFFWVYLCSLFALFLIDFFVNIFTLKFVIYSFSYIFNFIIVNRLIKSNKSPLIKTKKALENFSISVIILIIISVLNFPFLLLFCVCFLVPIFSEYLNIRNKIRNKKFIKLAQEKIRSKRIKIIAITGSNGKTSVKNILLEMIKSSHPTQATPSSYNTPLGISKFINENLNSNTKILILEYGARRKNDIKKLCEIFGADIGIITTIAPQHLETFKSIENVFKTKRELSNFLHNKICVFNLDNLYSYRMFYDKPSFKIGTSIYSQTDVHASNICVENFQTNFSLKINNKSFSFCTKLLGKHNISNICLAVAVAKYLNVPDDEIAKAIQQLSPTPHRLEYIKSHINILDDSYNCSLASAVCAVEVLKSTKPKKMIVTPGIVECGKNRFSINEKLGKLFDEIDFCVIVGNENKKAILSGIESLKHKPKLFFANTLDEAKKYFSKLKKNDTLLLLNDLPDDYR